MITRALLFVIMYLLPQSFSLQISKARPAEMATPEAKPKAINMDRATPAPSLLLGGAKL